MWKFALCKEERIKFNLNLIEEEKKKKRLAH